LQASPKNRIATPVSTTGLLAHSPPHARHRDYRLYTVDEVLAEFLTACSASGPRIGQHAVRTVWNALQDRQWMVIPQSRSSLLEALALYEARPDKEYSLTDCISMQVMRREGLTEVLTNDHHFTQEGFHILFP
jgi:uncharacterized protein